MNVNDWPVLGSGQLTVNVRIGVVADAKLPIG